MSFLDAVAAYFTGEKNAAIGLAVLGIAMCLAGLYLWRGYGGGLGAGMGISVLVLGVLGIGGGVGLYVTVDKRGGELAQTFEDDPAEPVASEIARMEKVNANWSRLKLAWLVLIGGSLAAMFFVKRDWVTGLSLTILLLASAAMAFDTFAERRAELYEDRLESIASQQSQS